MASFRDGFKITDNGARVPPRFQYDALSSNGRTIYTAILWDDGSTSCNCPGWSNRKTCKHTRVAATLTSNRSDTGAAATTTAAAPVPISMVPNTVVRPRSRPINVADDPTF